eukprot:262463-Chlamydomonas_euryale.AAC.2
MPSHPTQPTWTPSPKAHGQGLRRTLTCPLLAYAALALGIDDRSVAPQQTASGYLPRPLSEGVAPPSPQF